MSDAPTTPDDKDRLISLPEAAEIYGFNPTYLRNLARRGRLKAQKIADLWVTTPQDMETYIASRQKRGVYRDDIQSPD
jgi:alpha-D-ribose 1-methylphosphonate 5-triphosphate diphosphatase PhnM